MSFTSKSLFIAFAIVFAVYACKPKQQPADEISAQPQALPAAYYRYKYPDKKTLYLASQVLGMCLGKELKAASFRWGVDKKKYSPMSFDSYLAGSEYSYYTTPAEMPLKNWILEQKDDSITPVTLFRQSLVLNHRNVFDSVVTMHTLLRNVSRWNSPYVVAQKAPSTPKSVEQVNTFFNKFIDIRGDLMERGGNFRGDHPGSWYRIWGMMAKFMISSPLDSTNISYTNPWFGMHRNYLRVVVAGFAENIKFILPGFMDDPDKARKGDLNARAANAAYWLTMTALNHPATLRNRSCEPESYLLSQQTTDHSE